MERSSKFFFMTDKEMTRYIHIMSKADIADRH